MRVVEGKRPPGLLMLRRVDGGFSLLTIRCSHFAAREHPVMDIWFHSKCLPIAGIDEAGRIRVTIAYFTHDAAEHYSAFILN
jgi:hypothetical protein